MKRLADEIRAEADDNPPGRAVFLRELADLAEYMAEREQEKQDGFTLTREQTAELVCTINGALEMIRLAVKNGGEVTFTVTKFDPAATMRMENLLAKMRRFTGQ